LTQAGSGNLVDSFAGVLALTALIATGYTISSALRLRTEEAAGHLEALLSAPVGRRRWAARHVVMAMAGSALVLVAAGAGVGLAHAIGSADASQLPRLTAAALAQVPATWVLGAIAIALFGLAPRATVAAWGALGACVLLWLLKPLLHAPGWLLDVSPFEHVPGVPATSLAAGPLLALVAVAVAGPGFVAFSRRDVR